MNILLLTKCHPNIIKEYSPTKETEYIEYEHFFSGWNDGFILLGHTTFLNWNESFFFSSNLKIKFPLIYRILNYLMRITGFKKIDRILFSKKIAMYCKKNKIDLIFTELNSFISPKLIKSCNPNVICTEWFGVFPDMVSKDMLKLASEYDILWTPCEFDMGAVVFSCIEKLRYIGCSVNEKLYYYDFDPQYAFDIVFIGGLGPAHQDRSGYLEEIANCFENFVFYGYGDQFIPKNCKLKNKFRGWAPADISRKLFSSSKIAINLTLDSYHRIKRGFNARLFEIAACGGALQLCSSDSKISEFFEIGKDLDVFTDKGSLIRKIEYYLAAESKRKELVGNSHNKSKKYTYSNRSHDLIEQANVKSF